MQRTLVWSLALVLALGGVAMAQSSGSPTDFVRTGAYVGIGANYFIEHFEKYTVDLGSGPVEVDPPAKKANADNVGLDVRAGYRLYENWAAEFDAQWFGFESSFDATFNVKGYILPEDTKRLQLYGLGGAGLVRAENIVNVALGKNVDQLEFMGRFGAGADFYLTRNLLLNLEWAMALPTKDLEHYRFSTAVLGMQYRFN